MFKKFSLSIILALVIVAVAATTVFAQTDTTPTDTTPYGNYNGQRGGRFGGSRIDEVADFLGMSVDELQDAYSEGKTLTDILEEKGISLDEFQAALGAYNGDVFNMYDYENDYCMQFCDGEDCTLEQPLYQFQQDRLNERLNDGSSFMGRFSTSSGTMMGQGMRGGRGFGVNQ